MTIYITNEQDLISLKPLTIKRRLNKILKELDKFHWDLSILIVDDKTIQEINKNYRNFDKATNVLSFSMLENNSDSVLDIYLNNKILGDLVISTETIVREAEETGYTTGEMFYFYLIHGLLHLLGYDHEKGPKEEQKHEKETERLFNLVAHSL